MVVIYIWLYKWLLLLLLLLLYGYINGPVALSGPVALCDLYMAI